MSTKMKQIIGIRKDGLEMARGRKG